MAAFQFPDPALQTTVVNPITGSTYQWKEPPGKWVVTVKMRDVGDIIWEGDSPPDPIGDYKLWYSTDTLELYFYYCDAAGTCAWVPTSAPITMLEDLDNTVFEIRRDLNQTNVAVRENENRIGRTIYFSDSAPAIYPDEEVVIPIYDIDGVTVIGEKIEYFFNELNYKFWYDTDRLELLILYKDPDENAYSYVPVSLPLTNIDLDALNTQVQANSYSNNQQQQAIEALEGFIFDRVSKTGGDEMESPLDIKAVGYGEGTLNLTGKRDSAGVTCAKITFNNTADEDNPGSIQYNTLNGNAKFTFDQDIKLDSGDSDNQANLNFSANGQIQQGGNRRITFQNKSSGNAGDGLVMFSRPGNVARRGVAIRGNIVDPDDNTQMIETDLLYSYTNNTGTPDAINYLGKSDGGNNIVNYKTMQKYIKDLGVNVDNYEQITYEPLKEDLTIVEGAWTGSAGEGNLKVESLEDVSTHVGWMPNNTGKIFEGQPLKFVHDSGVRYGRVEAVWSNSNTTHLTVGDWAGDPFVAGEKTTVEYQLAPFVKKEGDTMSGNLTIKKTENGPASGGTQGQEAKLILNGDRNGTSNAAAAIEFKSESSAAGKTGYLAYYSGDADASKTIFTLNKPVETGGLYVNANNKGKTDGPGNHEYSFVVNSTSYASFFVQGNDAFVRNNLYIGAYSENDSFSGAKKVATEEVAAKYRTRLDLGAYKYRRTGDSWGSGSIQSNTTTNTGDMFEFKIHHTNLNSIAHTKQLLDQSIGAKMYIGLYRTNDNYYQGRITSVDRTDNKGVIVTCTLVKQKGTFTLDSTIWVTLSYNPQEMYVHTLS